MVMKNIPMGSIFEIAEQVQIQKGQVVSKTIVQNRSVSITIFAFDKDEEISTHESRGDAFVTVLEGTGRFTVGDEVNIVRKGQSIIMPAGIPHAVYGEKKFKMMLVVVFPPEPPATERPISPA